MLHLLPEPDHIRSRNQTFPRYTTTVPKRVDHGSNTSTPQRTKSIPIPDIERENIRDHTVIHRHGHGIAVQSHQKDKDAEEQNGERNVHC